MVHKLSAVILRSSEEEDWDLFLTAKKAFQACMDEDSIEQNGYRLWKEEVENIINGFPMAEDFWRQGAFDPNYMVKMMKCALPSWNYFPANFHERLLRRSS